MLLGTPLNVDVVETRGYEFWEGLAILSILAWEEAVRNWLRYRGGDNTVLCSRFQMGFVLNLQGHSNANTEKLVVYNVMLIKTKNICIECIWKLPYPSVPTPILYEPKALLTLSTIFAEFSVTEPQRCYLCH